MACLSFRVPGKNSMLQAILSVRVDGTATLPITGAGKTINVSLFGKGK